MEQKKENQNQEETNKQQAVIPSKPIDFYYPQDHKEKQIVDSDLPSNLAKYFNIIGQDFSRRYNYHFFNDSDMLIANANTFQIINIQTYDRQIIHSTEIGGVGAVVIHPEKKFFAVAENGEFPNIYIYEYPSLNLYRILRKGTERGYTALNFNSRGDMLASVGTDPDYNLLIWNWVNESIILKAKAFSQEIFNVQFSSNIEGKLITSGIGHIKFWEMANTFTGLKLQGELGKFGQIDLSDISAFVEFPDGKVLSGTEYGTFLLWEGIFIKAHFMIEEKNNCHEGLIEYMSWDTLNTKFIDNFKEKYTEEASAKIRQENRNTDDYFESQQINERINELISKIEIPDKILCILTGGYDGYLKWWIFTDFENANIDDNSIAFIKPAVEKLLINPVTNLPVKIINLVKQGDFWVVQDGNGYLLKLNFVYETVKTEKANAVQATASTKEADFNFNIEVIYNFNSGSVIKTKLLFPSPYLLIHGSDSNTFLYNLNAKNFLGDKILLESNTELKSTSCDIAQRESENDILIMAVGYDIGLLRIYQFNNDTLKLTLLTQLKAHEEPIKKVLFSPDKSYIITQTNTEIFIFIIDDYNKIIPFCSIRKNYNIVDLDWHPESKKFIVGLSDGSVEEIEIPLNFDNSKSFLMTEYNYKKFIVRLAENQLEKDEEKSNRRKNEQKKKKEPAPAAIISCKYINMYKEGDFLVTAQKPYNEFLYLCNFDNEYYNDNEDFPATTPRPVTFWKLPKPVDYSIKYISKNYIVLCNNKGYVQIRNKNLLDKFVEIFPNSYSSIVIDISISEEEKLISVSYRDGTVVNYVLNHEGYTELIQLLKVDPYNFDSKKIDVKQGEEPAFEKVENAIEVLKTIKKNEYEVNEELVEKNRKEELEKMISLEKEKKDAEEREKLKKAEETKNQTRHKIKKLRDEFSKVISQNSALNEEVRLTEEELVVDDSYLEHVKKNHADNLEDVKHKYDWLKANIQVTIDKMKSFFLDSVKTNKVYVFALQTNDFVNTLRCPNLPADFKARLNFLNSEIAELQRRIDFDVLENEYKKYMPNDDEKNDNVQDTENILNKIRNRIQEYYDGEKESEGAVKSAEMNKNSIKQELEYTNDNYSELVKIIEDKKHVKNKVVQFSNDHQKEKNKKDKFRGKGNQHLSSKNSMKCPKSYSLKINNDKYYTEATMLTTLIHKKKIYDFLEILFEEREGFNNRVIGLRKKKMDLIKKLKDLKEKLYEINKELDNDEKFDWLDFSFNENLEFPEKDFQVQNEELDVYVADRAKKDREILKIFKSLENKEEEKSDKNNPNNETSLLFKDRVSKKKNENELESEYRSINLIKFEFKKNKLLNECKKLIKDFDSEVKELKKIKLNTAFKQKLGEFELLIKHEEFSILRAFESEDMVLIKKLEDLCYDYNENCNNLKNCHEGILSNEEALEKATQGREAKIREFNILIAQEKEAKAKLEKIFYQKSKRSEARDGGDDKLENDDEGEDARPKNIQSTLFSEVINLKDLRENYDADIEKLKKSITLSKKTREHLISTKQALDRRKTDIRNKINANERKKSRYLNLIDITIPLKLDKFCKFQPRGGNNEQEILKLSLDISKAVLISDYKLRFLEDLYKTICLDNAKYEEEINDFKETFTLIEKDIKDVTKKKNELETNFKNEQILKFGIVIKFENLLKASKDNLVDKLEQEYKNLKRDVDVYIDKKKYDLETNKKENQELMNENTDLLKNIKDLLEKNKKFDITLEEKNNEINQKDGRKYSMYNIKEKKLKLKEILNLLEQQMKALKKEIDIFRKKGGHIYSTIISNLN